MRSSDGATDGVSADVNDTIDEGETHSVSSDVIWAGTGTARRFVRSNRREICFNAVYFLPLSIDPRQLFRSDLGYVFDPAVVRSAREHTPVRQASRPVQTLLTNKTASCL